MIGPKKKRSIRKKHVRNSAWKDKVMKKLHACTQIVKCSHCGENKRAHRVCSACGWYAGKQVMTVKSSSGKVLEA